MIVSEASLRALEFESLLALVASQSATDLGHERILALRPLVDRPELDRRRELQREVGRLIAEGSLVSSRERDLGPILRGLEAFDQDLGGRDLLEIGAMLQTTDAIVARVASADPPCPTLGELTGVLPRLGELARRLHKTFDARGEIREDASPLLATLRGRIRGVRQRIYDQLSGMVEENREHLSEETIPMRGGRLVLVLQAGARGKVPGLMHGRSGSGKSYYFEPLDAVENNNQLQQAVEDEMAEKRRILLEVIGLLRDNLPAVRAHAELLAQVDAQQAAFRFGERSGGGLAEIGARHQLRLIQARHPLLDPALSGWRSETLGQQGHTGSIVPLDLTLDGERRALVITGPNAGGKTVALKTTGIFALAHQCGLPVPAAAGTRLPIFSALVATVGDDQDLLADRSTFSGRLLRLREAWDAADADALIVLDELGSGTDPEEGAALSSSLLEGLLERRSLVLVTTHLTQVAAFALEAEGAVCAAMQFDPATGRPTYRLFPGPPGGSEALALAERLGLPRAWLDRAERWLGSEHRNLRRMLEELERHRAELLATQESLSEELQSAEQLRRRLEERETELATERRGLAEKTKRQLEVFRIDATQKLRAEIERLQEATRLARLEPRLALANPEVAQARKESLGAIVERVLTEAPVVQEEPELEELPVRVGGRVRHRRLGWVGVLEKLERGRAQVRVDGRTLLCKDKELVGAAEKEQVRATPVPVRPVIDREALMGRRSDAAPSAASQSPAELNLVGARVEAALERLDNYLDQAMLSPRTSVRVIHGHGSGRLRAAVRDHLRKHPAVDALRPGAPDEGGDGATVVELSR
jgi:DNA mismatch repair protein MutS2